VTAAALKEPAVTPVGTERRLKILRPLKDRDFAFLWTGMTISIVGDGIYMVALPFLVYQISNLPTALAAVGAAWTIPQVIFLLLAGVVTDRFDRRRVLIGSDLLRAFAIGLAGGLSVMDALELWHLYILVAIFGAGEAFFMPAFGAIVPEVVPKDQLVEANSLDQFVRPIGMRLAGPVIGGLVVAAAGPGEAFLVDAATFVFSAVMVMAMRRRARAEISSKTSVSIELREGLGFIRSKPWLWGGLLATALGQFAFYGPWVVLVPFVIRNSLDGGASNYGWVLAAGGVGRHPRLDRDRGERPARSTHCLRVVHVGAGNLLPGGVRGLGHPVAPDRRGGRAAGRNHGRSDRLGDPGTSLRTKRAARQGLQRGLARVDEPAAALLLGGRPGGRGVRRAPDADRCRDSGSRRDACVPADPWDRTPAKGEGDGSRVVMA
jgi:MFS family permease